MCDGGMGDIWLVDVEQRTTYFYQQSDDGDYEDDIQIETPTDTDLLRGFYSPS